MLRTRLRSTRAADGCVLTSMNRMWRSFHSITVLASRRKIDPALLKDEPFILFSPDMAQGSLRSDARSLRRPRLSSQRSAGSRTVDIACNAHRRRPWRLDRSGLRCDRPRARRLLHSPSSQSAAPWWRSPSVKTPEIPPLPGWWSTPGSSRV